VLRREVLEIDKPHTYHHFACLLVSTSWEGEARWVSLSGT
jgi:hypothetical protein